MKIRARAILVIVFTNLAIILFSITAGTAYVRKRIESYIETDMLVVADIADEFISAELDLLCGQTLGKRCSLGLDCNASRTGVDISQILRHVYYEPKPWRYNFTRFTRSFKPIRRRINSKGL